MPKAARDSLPERRPALRGRSAFDRVYRTGRRHRAGGVLMIAASPAAIQPSVGFVAGRRVGSAVARNRAKRRLREAVRGVALPQADIIFVASPEVVTVPYSQVVGWIEEVCDDARR